MGIPAGVVSYAGHGLSSSLPHDAGNKDSAVITHLNVSFALMISYTVIRIFDYLSLKCAFHEHY